MIKTMSSVEKALKNFIMSNYKQKSKNKTVRPDPTSKNQNLDSQEYLRLEENQEKVKLNSKSNLEQDSKSEINSQKGNHKSLQKTKQESQLMKKKIYYSEIKSCGENEIMFFTKSRLILISVEDFKIYEWSKVNLE